eukprot:715941-Prymnesium_polylepis.1
MCIRDRYHAPFERRPAPTRQPPAWVGARARAACDSACRRDRTAGRATRAAPPAASPRRAPARRARSSRPASQRRRGPARAGSPTPLRRSPCPCRGARRPA